MNALIKWSSLQKVLVSLNQIFYEIGPSLRYSTAAKSFMGLVSEAFEKESWPLQSNIQDNNLGF
jgi:hypothetical protein